MRQNTLGLLLISALLLQPSLAEGGAAVPFLGIHPSPNLNAMGGAFTATPSSDPFGHYFNPAQLGNFSRQNNFAFGFYPAKTNWLPNFGFSSLTFNSKALSFGYSLKEHVPGLPVSLGFGYIQTHLNLGENIWTDEEGNVLGSFHSEEYYSAYSFGIGLDYLLRFNFGYTFKKITSNLGGLSYFSGCAKANAYDLGLLVTAPLITFAERSMGYPITLSADLHPILDFSLGYTVSNIGDNMNYGNEFQSDPLPRTAKIGIAITAGLARYYGENRIHLIKIDLSNEAHDLLIKKYPAGSNKYSDAPGDINIWDHVINGKSDENISLYQGWRFNLFETIQYSQGRYSGPGYPKWIQTSGLRLNSSGLIKWLAPDSKSGLLNYMAKHLSISYSTSRIDVPGEADHPLQDTEFEGITISIFGY